MRCGTPNLIGVAARSGAAVSRRSTLESRIYRTVDVRFGGGPTEKAPGSLGHLASGLPYFMANLQRPTLNLLANLHE